MTDRELLELIATQVGALTNRVDALTDEMKDVKSTLIRIEHDHGRKLEALFDGYHQVSEQITRVEEEVKK